jgi:hypothetical protein
MSIDVSWGIIIQGPIISFGQGPNNVKAGFSALNSIENNIKNFLPYVSKIVVSTWEDSGLNFQDKYSSKVVLIENIVPDKDPDNRIKQFASTYSGAKYLTLNSKVTHILKIRTDQVVDPKIIEWFNHFFTKHYNSINKELKHQESYLFFSDMMKNNPFYMGDFIFAGKSNDIVSFCKSNLQFKGKNIHPEIGKDYILKYLLLNSSLFWKFFYKKIPFLWQVSNNSNEAIQSYWTYIMNTGMAVIPSSFFWSIIWRNRLMSDVISDSNREFVFYEDWKKISQRQEKKLKLKNWIFLIPTIEVIQKVKYQLIRYWKKRIIYYYRKLK